MQGAISPERVLPLLKGRFGRPYRYAERCASTQLLLGEDDPEGAVAVCEEQTAGRGRLGRRWSAPYGTSLLCSLVLRPPPARNPAELSLVAGLATAEAIEGALGEQAAIKWPNDVLVRGRKVAGILAERRAPAVVLGIGVNVAQTADQLPADARLPAASLRTLGGRDLDRAELLASLLCRLEHRYDEWGAEGLESLLDELRARDALLGKHVSVGEERGLGAGIDDAGRLLLRAPGRVIAVSSGDAVASIEPE